ncbi:MAG TPA: hypothetical protein VFQ32_06490 [Ktedonobacterales bacterium]|nr:hypothetical protein [Ktedonobacterales bacterium]
MGARANYVIIEDGAIDIYYSHWGAMSVPAVVIDGPKATSDYIRDLSPFDRLMNDTWAEGGILLDADTHTLLFFGGKELPRRPDLRRLFLRAIRLTWPEWLISWATHGVVDFAEYPGVAAFLEIDPASVRDTSEYAVEKPYPEAKIRNPHRNPWIWAVITVAWDDGRVTDYTFDDFADGYLIHGPDLLGILRDCAPDILPREDGDGQHVPLGGGYIDVTEHVLWAWNDGPVSPTYIERLAHAWPGWRVAENLDGLTHQVRLSGRDPALVAVPVEEAVATLIKELASGLDDSYPLKFAQKIQAQSAPDSTRFAPGFFRVDNPGTPSEERRVHLAHLLEAAVKRDQDGDFS